MTDVRDYLERKGWEFKEVTRPSGLQAVLNCPLCNDHDRKFAISLDTGAWQCLRKNHCGESGSLRRLQELMGDTPDTYAAERTFRHSRRKPTYTKPQKPVTTKLSAQALEYLKGRGFDEERLALFGLYSPKPDVIAFPYRKDGELVGVKYRSLDKRFWNEKGAEPILYNRDAVEPSTVVLVEGELDAIAWEHYGVRVVSVPNGTGDTRWIEHCWEWLEPFTKILICTDTDDAGEQAAQMIAKRLGEWRCWRVTLPYKDAADCLREKVPADLMNRALDEAEPYDVPALKIPGSYVTEVSDFLLNPSARDGLPTGLRGLDHLLKGWRMGEVTVWTGRNGSGKTTLLGQLMLHLIQEHEQRVAITSLEMRPAHLLGWITLQDGAAMTVDSIAETVQSLDGKLYVHDHVGILSPKAILDAWTYAARRYGVKHFVLDSLMRVDLDGSDFYRAQKDAVNQLCSFAQEHGAHVHLVAHPRKGATDDDTPGKTDVSGSGDITNAAHNVLVLWRPTSEAKAKMANGGMYHDAVLYVRKNRAHGYEGKVRLSFDGNAKRFAEVLV